MTRALIGHTGFVGSNLLARAPFDFLFNSGNFRDMTGRSFDEIVCAGLSAVKWKANKEPEKDRDAIAALESVLATVRAGRMILISTIDVYPVSQGADESFDCHSLENHAYGRHRLAFEDFCRRTFPQCTIVRLPGLFGPGLKKNILYDLLHDNCLEMINPASSFQYYDLAWLAEDIEHIVRAGIDLINLFTEPVSTAAVLKRFFPGKAVGDRPAPECHYDLWTRHASLWNRSGRYRFSREDILEAMSAFIEKSGGATR
jgi:hypothetical protein